MSDALPPDHIHFTIPLPHLVIAETAVAMMARDVIERHEQSALHPHHATFFMACLVSLPEGVAPRLPNTIEAGQICLAVMAEDARKAEEDAEVEAVLARLKARQEQRQAEQGRPAND